MLHVENITPKFSKNFLKKVKFNVDPNEITSLQDKIKKGYGQLICLSKKHNLFLQYHGVFNSFLIGIGINPENPNQPDIKLLRIELIVEKTHEKSKLNGEIPLGPHTHWFEGKEPSYITNIKTDADPLKMLDDILNRKII